MHGCHVVSRIAGAGRYRHIRNCRCDAARILLPRVPTATTGPNSSPPPWSQVHRQMAYPPPSSICHTLITGSARSFRPHPRMGPFFRASGLRPPDCRKRMAGVPNQRLSRPAARPILVTNRLRPLLLPGRVLHGQRSGDDPKAPLIPSSGVFHFGASLDDRTVTPYI